VAVLTAVLAVAVVALGSLLLVLVYASVTHSAARWQAAADAHNLAVARWDAERRTFVVVPEDAAA
jgi:hypothetical protein